MSTSTGLLLVARHRRLCYTTSVKPLEKTPTEQTRYEYIIVISIFDYLSADSYKEANLLAGERADGINAKIQKLNLGFRAEVDLVIENPNND